MINENLQYPGIIGTNAKFPSFRYFIDFVLSNIKVLNEFKEEIQNIDFNDYKKRINNEIQGLKYNIDDNYRNTRNMVEDCIKETNSKISNYAFDFFKKTSENNDKIENIENKIKEYFNDYQTKITLIQDDFRDKYNQQFNQIENLRNMQREYNYKNIQNEVYNKNDNHKKRKSKTEKIKFDLINLEKNEKKNKENDNNTNPILFKKLLYNNKREIKSNPSDSIILNSENYEKIKEKNIINSIIEDKTKEQKIIDSNKQDDGDHLNNNEVKNITENNSNNKYTKLNVAKQLLSSRVSLYNKITNSTKNNSNNKINFYETKIKKNIEDNKFNNNKHIKNSFEFIKDKEKNPNKEMNNSEVKKKIKNLNFNFLQKFPKKIFPNNYSITNIPHINFKRIVIPDPLHIANNCDGLYKTFISDNYFKTIKESINFDKNSLNDNQNNKRNIIKSLSGNNLEKINNIKRIDTIKMKNNKMGICQKESKYDSLKVYHIKNKDQISNSFNNIKKENKNKSLSYEKKKSDKGIYITSGVSKINKQKDKDKTKKIFSKKYEFLYNIKV